MRKPIHCRAALPAICLLALVCGCAETSLFKGTARIETATPKEPAVQVLCIWQPARGRGANGMPTRGMAGQLMFFTRNKPSPVAVEGDVRIYLFDNVGTPAEQAKPIHQFDFPGDTWQAHLHSGNLGASYHVFVPYVRGGYQQVECSLQVRFTPKDGPVVYSEMASVVLPGTPDPNEVRPEVAGGRTVHEQPPSAAAAEPRTGKPGLAVHTIRPEDFARRPGLSKSSLARPPITDRAVQQAAATFEVAPVPEDRLDRLERMMSRLLEQQSPPSSAPAASPRHPLADAPEPPAAYHPLTASLPPLEKSPRRRFRLTPAAPAMQPVPLPNDEPAWSAEPAPTARHPLHDGIGTSYYPDWMSLEGGSRSPSHPLWTE